jgi:hypothetical protein
VFTRRRGRLGGLPAWQNIALTPSAAIRRNSHGFSDRTCPAPRRGPGLLRPEQRCRLSGGVPLFPNHATYFRSYYSLACQGFLPRWQDACSVSHWLTGHPVKGQELPHFVAPPSRRLHCYFLPRYSRRFISGRAHPKNIGPCLASRSCYYLAAPWPCGGLQRFGALVGWTLFRLASLGSGRRR